MNATDETQNTRLGLCLIYNGFARLAAKKEQKKTTFYGSPVWFLEDNPIVGYHTVKNGVRILFWSGKSFGIDGLTPEGSFKAGEARYVTADEVKLTLLRRWLRKAKTVQWDYKNIVKNRGILQRLK